jgi:hypothetical protein
LWPRVAHAHSRLLRPCSDTAYRVAAQHVSTLPVLLPHDALLKMKCQNACTLTVSMLQHHKHKTLYCAA